VLALFLLVPVGGAGAGAGLCVRMSACLVIVIASWHLHANLVR
jgi:hypothetical protein